MGKLNFELIYEIYFEQVYKYILKLSNDVHLTEDITADTFMKALLNINKFNSKSSVSTWLISIARNSYISYLRKNNRVTEIENLPAYYLSEDDDTLEKLVDEDEVNSIYTWIHQLKEPYKEVFMLRVLGELSFKDIGKMFRKSDNWACVTYHRARMMIREKGGLNED